jgi:hypothetical protein
MTKRALFFGVALLLSCGSDDATSPGTAQDGTELLPGFDLAPPPADAVQVVSMPIRNISPGSNTEYCAYTSLILDHDIAIKGAQAFQSKNVHHNVGYWTKVHQPPGVRVCTEDDMINFNILTGGGGEGTSGTMNALPEGSSFRIPKGAQLVVNAHVINPSAKPIDAQAALNLKLAEPGLTPLTTLYVAGTEFEVGPRQKTSYETSCKLARDMKFVRLLGHEHGNGTRTELWFGDELVYDKETAGDFQFNPPVRDYPIGAPLVLKAGQEIKARCTWQNDGEQTLVFPNEMCVAFAYLIGDDPDTGCVNGRWEK